MKISIDGYSFHGLLQEGKMDIFHYLESLKYRYNVDAAGIWNGFFTSTDEDYIRKVREAIVEKEMVVPNIAVDGASVWDDNPEKREANYRNALANLKAAEILGAKSVRIDWGVTSPDITEEQFDFIANRYWEYCSIAYNYGINVGPENHFGASLNPHLMKKMVKAIGHPAYKILLHAGHWNVDTEIGDRLLAPYAMHTHLDQKTVETQLEEKLRILSAAGYTGYWGVEHHTAKSEFAQVECQLASIKRAIIAILD